MDISTTLRIALPFAPVLFAFLAFMHWNHGIVLGDKTMHVAVLHIPQVYYFTAFVAVMSAPVLGLSASTIKAVLRTIAGSLSLVHRTSERQVPRSSAKVSDKHLSADSPFPLSLAYRYAGPFSTIRQSRV